MHQKIEQREHTVQHKPQWFTPHAVKHNRNMKNDWFWVLNPFREQQYGFQLQLCNLQSRSLSVLMITRDAFSAKYFKSRAQERIIDAASTSNKHMHSLYYCSWWKELRVSRLYTTCGHLALNVQLCQKAWITAIHCCSVASGLCSYLNYAYRRVYICLCDSPIFHKAAGKCEKHNLKKKERKKRQYTSHNSFNYSFQGNCQQMLFFVCFVCFRLNCSKARLLLCMNRETKISGGDNLDACPIIEISLFFFLF